MANLPDIFYFQANVTFPDSIAISDADVASFAIEAPASAEPAQCPCGIDDVKAQRAASPQGASLAISVTMCEKNLHTLNIWERHCVLSKMNTSIPQVRA